MTRGDAEAPPSRTSQPDWDQTYASCAPRTDTLEIDGLSIAVRTWAPAADPDTEQRPDVVLVHGGAAQGAWWDHIAPLLRGAGQIVALDLTGHGDSSRRDVYTSDGWAADVRGVVAALDLSTRPVLVGHSLGGLVAVRAAQQAKGDFSGVMALESPPRRVSGGAAERREKIASRPVRSYPSREEALASYKTHPGADGAPAAVMAHIAAHAYRRVEDRWALKFDPGMYRRQQETADFIESAEVPTLWVRAEHGFIDDRLAERIAERLGSRGRVATMPAAGHHCILEQPVAVAWMISDFLQRRHGPC